MTVTEEAQGKKVPEPLSYESPSGRKPQAQLKVTIIMLACIGGVLPSGIGIFMLLFGYFTRGGGLVLLGVAVMLLARVQYARIFRR